MRRNRVQKKLKKLLPAVTVSLTAFPFAAWSPVAEAFFPPVWPISPPTVSVAPPDPPPVTVPPVSPPPFIPPPPPPVIVVPPVSPPPITVPPVSPPCTCTTPEPATLVSSLVGLAAVAGYGLKRRKNEADPKG